jgi:hypothetical protein
MRSVAWGLVDRALAAFCTILQHAIVTTRYRRRGRTAIMCDFHANTTYKHMLVPKWIPNRVPKWVRNLVQNGSKIWPKMGSKSGPKWDQNLAQNGPKIWPKMGPNLAQNGPKSGPKWGPNLAQNGPKSGPKPVPESVHWSRFPIKWIGGNSIPGQNLGQFGYHFGPNLGPFWARFWAHFGPDLGLFWARFGSIFGPDFGPILGQILSPFWARF